MNRQLHAVIELLVKLSDIGAEERALFEQLCETLTINDAEELGALFAALERSELPAEANTNRLLWALFQRLIALRRSDRKRPARDPLWHPSANAILHVYKHLGKDIQARMGLLQMLAQGQSQAELDALVELMVEDPPLTAQQVAACFAPLLQDTASDVPALFPKLFDALHQPSVAVVAIDLANFCFRQKIVATHPAFPLVDRLELLFGTLVGRLGKLEENPLTFSSSAENVSEMVNESVALAISVCDAFALMDHRRAIGKLYQAAELKHRRLRVEAAAALAKLGEIEGGEILIGMASEPTVRLRVLAYAEELGLLDSVDESFQQPESIAEAELVLWLADPSQFGFPPEKIELMDVCTLFWPGYDEPVRCHLFRFEYLFGERQYDNIGIAGPVTRAMQADLADLPPQDIYALFAGWSAEHEEITESEPADWGPSDHAEADRMQRRLRDRGHSSIKPLLLARFFGTRVLVAESVHEGNSGWAIVDDQDITWQAKTSHARPIGPDEHFMIYKGRRILRTFNP